MNNDIKIKLPITVLAFVAVVCFIAMCLPWIAISYVNVTGIDFMAHTADMGELMKIIDVDITMSWQLFVPLVVLILATGSAILAALPAFKLNVNYKIRYGLIILFGLIMVFLVTAYGLTKGDSPSSYEWIRDSLAAMGGSGYKMAFAMSFIPLFIGALGLLGAFNPREN